MTRRFVPVLVAVLVLSACGGSVDQLTVDDLDDVAVDTELRSRRVTLDTGEGDTAVRIVADIADAYRYRATVAFGGVDTYDELVVDDRRWVRISSAAPQRRLATDVPRCLAESDADPAAAVGVLTSGGWIEDDAGAPPEFPGSDAQPRAVDPAPVLQAVRFLEGLPELLDEAASVGEWNPRAVSYIPSQDRFEPRTELGVRFDGLPPEEFDADRVFRDGIPSPSDLEDYFRFVGVWVDDAEGAVRRVEVLVDVPDLRDDIARVQDAEAERRGAELGADAPTVPLPSSSHAVFTVEDAAPAMPARPVDAPAVDLVCLAAPGVEAPVVAGPAGVADQGASQ